MKAEWRWQPIRYGCYPARGTTDILKSPGNWSWGEENDLSRQTGVVGAGREDLGRHNTAMAQLQLPVFPAGVTPINNQIAVACESGKVVYVLGHQPVFQHGDDDLASFRLFKSQCWIQSIRTRSSYRI